MQAVRHRALAVLDVAYGNSNLVPVAREAADEACVFNERQVRRFFRACVASGNRHLAVEAIKGLLVLTMVSKEDAMDMEAFAIGRIQDRRERDERIRQSRHDLMRMEREDEYLV